MSVNSLKQANDYHRGMDVEINNKIMSRMKPEELSAALNWVYEVMGSKGAHNGDFHESLKDGIALCKCINVIKPGTVGKINTMKAPFMLRENIVAYLDGCKKLGVTSLFTSNDLFEGDNLVAVLDNIFNLSGVAKTMGYKGATIGVAQSNQQSGPFKFEVQSSGCVTETPKLAAATLPTDRSVPMAAYHSNIIKTSDISVGGQSQQNRGILPQDRSVPNAAYHTNIKKL